MRMQIFAALADKTRLRILEVLAGNGPLPASEIYAHFSLTAPAISQHLKTLKEANLVTVESRAQHRYYTLNPSSLTELEQWILHMRDASRKQPLANSPHAQQEIKTPSSSKKKKQL